MKKLSFANYCKVLRCILYRRFPTHILAGLSYIYFTSPSPPGFQTELCARNFNVSFSPTRVIVGSY